MVAGTRQPRLCTCRNYLKWALFVAAAPPLASGAGVPCEGPRAAAVETGPLWPAAAQPLACLCAGRAALQNAPHMYSRLCFLCVFSLPIVAGT